MQNIQENLKQKFLYLIAKLKAETQKKNGTTVIFLTWFMYFLMYKIMDKTCVCNKHIWHNVLEFWILNALQLCTCLAL